ncbi:MAG: tRNA (cytidine(34)-2'-O)-methyltransferase [Betaproteobacteria bacterium]|nr:tRNA (cytidine(34)-2'-O)-methyltransferase [Betaproteobacteria bacterium]
MFDIVLFEPEIPPNTGNIIRLCANTGASLHLVRPLGFNLRNRQLLRAGLDYHELARVAVHRDWSDCLEALGPRRLFAVTTRARRRYDEARFAAGDAFVFGAESRGLPAEVLNSVPEARQIRLPMKAANRSLNLANAVAVVVYEAWRQNGFAGGS